MTDGRLNINFLRLQETSGHVETAIRAMSSQLEQLEKDAAPLVAAWGGEAKQAYQQRQETWRQASAELTVTLQAIKRALDDTIADFQTTEKGNTRLFLPG
jgi:WXG100 family type VII secretion target